MVNIILYMSFRYGKNPFKTTKNKHSILYVDGLFESAKANIDANFINPAAKLNSMHNFNKMLTYIYSDEGVFVATDENLFRVTYTDDIVEHIEFTLESGQVIRGSIDTSREKKLIKTNQLPYTSHSISMTKYCFAFSKSSDVTLTVLIENDKLHDIYFELKDNINHPFIKQHISSLLSCIN